MLGTSPKRSPGRCGALGCHSERRIVGRPTPPQKSLNLGVQSRRFSVGGPRYARYMNRAPPADSLPLDVVLRCSYSEGKGSGALVIHGRLLRLAQLRERYQETLGNLAVLFQSVDGWRR